MWPLNKKAAQVPSEVRIIVTSAGIEVCDGQEISFTPLRAVSGLVKRKSSLCIYNVNASMTLMVAGIDAEKTYSEILRVMPNA